jgi:sulfite exporter TauE/SafE
VEQLSLLSILTIGFLLGIKHALEPDHIIGVSTIASQSKKLWKSSLVGVFWGIGHTSTLFVVGMLLIVLKISISDKWAMSLEFLVGIMLVYFGVTAMASHRKSGHHDTQASGADGKFSYRKPLIMGFIHGLAGSAAIILLTLGTVDSVWQGAAYILVFGLGTIVSMLFFNTVIGIPFVMSKNKRSINKQLIQFAGLLSAAFGLYYMYNLGFNEGLFRLWI